MDNLRELDYRLAELLGKCLIPPRELAMVKVGWEYIAITGPVFKLRTGESLPMPNGNKLRQPEGSDDWNDRYALYVAEYLGDRIKDEVDDIRIEPPHYSTDPAACAEMDEKMRERGYNLLISCNYKGANAAYYKQTAANISSVFDIFNEFGCYGATEWEARTRAAISALERSKKDE
jgi:hypothetical protein